jgi:hypothetical protein
MGYNVGYEFYLSAHSSVSCTFVYDRGQHGWLDSPVGVPGEGLQNVSKNKDKDSNSRFHEWLITIDNGEVKFLFRSEKFYSHYMTRLLQLLKNEVPSLVGFVLGYAFGDTLYWSVALDVKEHATMSDVTRALRKRPCMNVTEEEGGHSPPEKKVTRGWKEDDEGAEEEAEDEAVEDHVQEEGAEEEGEVSVTPELTPQKAEVQVQKNPPRNPPRRHVYAVLNGRQKNATSLTFTAPEEDSGAPASVSTAASVSLMEALSSTAEAPGAPTETLKKMFTEIGARGLFTPSNVDSLQKMLYSVRKEQAAPSEMTEEEEAKDKKEKTQLSVELAPGERCWSRDADPQTWQAFYDLAIDGNRALSYGSDNQDLLKELSKLVKLCFDAGRHDPPFSPEEVDHFKRLRFLVVRLV